MSVEQHRELAVTMWRAIADRWVYRPRTPLSSPSNVWARTSREVPLGSGLAEAGAVGRTRSHDRNDMLAPSFGDRTRHKKAKLSVSRVDYTYSAPASYARW